MWFLTFTFILPDTLTYTDTHLHTYPTSLARLRRALGVQASLCVLIIAVHSFTVDCSNTNTCSGGSSFSWRVLLLLCVEVCGCVPVSNLCFPPQGGQGPEWCDIRHRAPAGLIKWCVLCTCVSLFCSFFYLYFFYVLPCPFSVFLHN